MSRLGILKFLGWGALGAGVLALPLLGDPRSAPVTHTEWGRMLLGAIDLTGAIDGSSQASQVFATLSWKNTLAYPAERYVTADGIEVIEPDAQARRRIVARGGVGSASYPIGVVRGGDYRLRLRIAGDPQNPASAEITPVGETRPVATFAITPASLPGWIDVATLHLDPGAYTTTILMPQGTALEYLELAPPCLNPVEPIGGWRSTALTSTGDVAVTALKALDAESELPPADTAIELSGANFQLAGSEGAMARSVSTSLDSLWLRAGPQGLQAVIFVDLPEDGLYSVSALSSGHKTRWLADACRKAVLCERQLVGTRSEWRHVLTNRFTGGRHFFTVALGPGAVIERVRVERKKESPADYLAALRRLGFDPGPDGTIVARQRARDAIDWLRGRRREAPAGWCGDLVLPPATVTADASGPQGPPGGVPPPGVVPPPPPPPPAGPLDPPVLPPLPPASPVQ